MKVFVIHKNGKPLMPTNPAKARHLLKAGKAKVIRRTPFTIQLTIDTGEATQEVNLGVDAGSKVVGLSATTEKEVFGFQLFDKVKYKGQECFIFGRRKSGNFDIRLLNNITINANANYKKLKLLDKSSTILIERIASNV